MEPMMTRDSRYDILFEPVRIGPVTARNRFYQVPHCNGMGYKDPSALAAMRGMKAEGGWAVVCTEMVEIHHTADVAPFIELRLWNDQDIPMLARIAEKVHEHGSLAGIELCHSGYTANNLWSREVPMAASPMPASSYNYDPVQARGMDKEDIRNLRRAHRQAALRSKQAGFDLVYVYAGHGLGIFQHFLSRATNFRSDEYGGSLENRARLLREVIEDTKDAVGDTCAVPVRIAMSEFQGSSGLEPAEVEDAIAMMAELPDLWDLSLSDWSKDSQTSRFSEEGFQEPYIKGVKKLTTKPVVGVGRYTSPDAMVRVIRQGIMDMIGAARPSIADPYLPNKIRDGRLDDIRECIGCNVCVTHDYTMTPLRCTQNPSMGEEWRRGWHPELIRPKEEDKHILVVGAGPAGLRRLGLHQGLAGTEGDPGPAAGPWREDRRQSGGGGHRRGPRQPRMRLHRGLVADGRRFGGSGDGPPPGRRGVAGACRSRRSGKPGGRLLRPCDDRRRRPFRPPICRRFRQAGARFPRDPLPARGDRPELTRKRPIPAEEGH